LAEGREAVRLARETVEAHVRKTKPEAARPLSQVFFEKRGVFVTLNTAEGSERSLRGCIGYSEPIKTLADAIRDVAVYVCEDPRFPHPVLPEELDHVVTEVSVLTVPTDLVAKRRTDLPAKVRIGVDGLIISNRFNSGLFLPQVSIEQGWDQETFVAEACAKAGLPYDAWLYEGTKVQTFQAEIFGEESPRGKIARVVPKPR
jgi:uncharacterized protein